MLFTFRMKKVLVSNFKLFLQENRKFDDKTSDSSDGDSPGDESDGDTSQSSEKRDDPLEGTAEKIGNCDDRSKSSDSESDEKSENGEKVIQFHEFFKTFRLQLTNLCILD